VGSGGEVETEVNVTVGTSVLVGMDVLVGIFVAVGTEVAVSVRTSVMVGMAVAVSAGMGVSVSGGLVGLAATALDAEFPPEELFWCVAPAELLAMGGSTMNASTSSTVVPLFSKVILI
jgi:hypothetical protein